MRLRIALACAITCAGSPLWGQSGTACPEPAGTGIVDRYCYDSLGRLIQHERSDEYENVFGYDDADNRTSLSVVEPVTNIVVVRIGGSYVPIILPSQ